MDPFQTRPRGKELGMSLNTCYWDGIIDEASSNFKAMMIKTCKHEWRTLLWYAWRSWLVSADQVNLSRVHALAKLRLSKKSCKKCHCYLEIICEADDAKRGRANLGIEYRQYLGALEVEPIGRRAKPSLLFLIGVTYDVPLPQSFKGFHG